MVRKSAAWSLVLLSWALMLSCAGDASGELAVEDGPSAAETFQPPAPLNLSDKQEAEVVRLALELDGVPLDAVPTIIYPAFDKDEIQGGVVYMDFAPWSGTLELPGDKLYDGPGGQVSLVNLYRYDVRNLTQIRIAVDIREDRIMRASPEFSPQLNFDDHEQPEPPAVAAEYISSSLVATYDRDGQPVNVEDRNLQPVRIDD